MLIFDMCLKCNSPIVSVKIKYRSEKQILGSLSKIKAKVYGQEVSHINTEECALWPLYLETNYW